MLFQVKNEQVSAETEYKETKDLINEIQPRQYIVICRVFSTRLITQAEITFNIAKRKKKYLEITVSHTSLLILGHINLNNCISGSTLQNPFEDVDWHRNPIDRFVPFVCRFDLKAFHAGQRSAEQ